MKSEKKITVEFTQEQLETVIEAIVRAAEQDAEDIELMANIPGPAQEIVKGLAQSRKTLLRMSAWIQHVLEEAG